MKLEIVDDFSQKKKNPLQNRKRANAAKRKVTEIYRLDNGALELLPIIPQEYLNDLNQTAEYSHVLPPSGVSAPFL